MPDVTSGRTGQRWATLGNLDYPTPRGYFMGPADPPADDTGSWRAPHRYTSELLWSVREYGFVPAVDRARGPRHVPRAPAACSVSRRTSTS